jgi:ankyrin repeat protein
MADDGTMSLAEAQSLNDQLHDAAAIGDVAALREALAAGAYVDERRTFNPDVSRTPLACVVATGMTISEERRTACVRALLLAGASPSAPITHPGGGCWMPSHEAAFLGLYTVCRLLLDAGADVNERDGRECTPLHYAAARQDNAERRQKLIALLLSRGAVDGPSVDPGSRSPYLQKVRAAGSFANYEKQHRAKLVAMLAPKFVHLLPTELVAVVITFWAPVGLH